MGYSPLRVKKELYGPAGAVTANDGLILGDLEERKSCCALTDFGLRFCQ
jgi:hypothetical protein